jgi:hypothetical protein
MLSLMPGMEKDADILETGSVSGARTFRHADLKLDKALDTALHSLHSLLCSHCCLEVGVSIVLLKNLPGKLVRRVYLNKI